MRRLQFKRVEILDDLEGKEVRRGYLDYYVTTKDILSAPSSNQGATSEEVITAVSAVVKLKEGKKAYDSLPEEKKPEVGSMFLDSETYSLIISKITTFRWALVHSVVSDYIAYMRGLKEEDVVVSSPADL